jgi:hypothetical protein
MHFIYAHEIAKNKSWEAEHIAASTCFGMLKKYACRMCSAFPKFSSNYVNFLVNIPNKFQHFVFIFLFLKIIFIILAEVGSMAG